MKKRRSFLRRGSKNQAHHQDELDTAAAAKAVQAMAEEEEEAVNDNTDDEKNSSTEPVVSSPGSPIQAVENDDNVATTQQQHQAARLMIVSSVHQACEEIWNSQEPQQAASWLELLHNALLHASLDSYMPSDVFMCISGAALRFHEQQEQSNDTMEDVLWKVWEEAMWAAAALARVCVGVAWRLQLCQRQEWIRRKKHGLSEEHDTRTAGSNNDDSSSSPRAKSLPMDVVSTEQSARSYSPMTNVTLSSHDALNHYYHHASDKHYPAIPENLPAAMLRFAAMETCSPPRFATSKDASEQQKWLDRRKSLAEAQRELVLALCYILPEEEPEDPEEVASRLEWTILEAHEPVASMVRSWLESLSASWHVTSLEGREEETYDSKPAASRSDQSVNADAKTIASTESTQSMGNTATVATTEDESQQTRFSTSPLESDEIDWWTALQVVRAAFQLVSAGWRIPQNETGEEIVAYLLCIAEKGMLLRVDELKSYETESDHVAREERLAASSSALTAVTILSALASVGLIPINMQPLTVTIMCRVQVGMSERGSNVLFPSGDLLVEQERAEWEADYETFMEQREDCISDIVALYWVLLAHSASAATTMAIFLQMTNLNEDAVKDEAVSNKTSKPAVVDMIHYHRAHALQSACIAVDAMSGALWGKPPDVPGIASLRIYWYNLLGALRGLSSCVHEWIVEIDRGWVETAESADEKRKIVHNALSLLLEVVVSLKRFIDEELLRGEGLLAPDEWEVFVSILDENVAKWLCMSDSTLVFAAETVAIAQIQSELGRLLDGLRDFFVQCTESESCPLSVVEDECRVKLYSVLLQKAVPYMIPEKGALLAVTILRSWSATGFAIHQSDQWARTASYMITDVFSVFEDQSFGPYKGYVHAPSVRLEALKLIALEEEDEQTLVDAEQFGSSQKMSPLEQSAHLREQYLALVNGSLLPPLMAMFGVQASASNIHVAVVLPLPTASFSASQNPMRQDIYEDPSNHGNENLSIKADDHALRRFAAKLLGRLYRSGTGEKWHRSILQMLISAAISSSLDDFRQSVKLPADEAASNVDPELLFTGDSHTSLQAIQELEKCLRLPFGSLPSAHESLPPVLDALCSVLIFYGGEPLRERNENDDTWLAMKRCLAIAAVLPLARLGISHDARLVLGRRRDISRLVPAQIVRLLGAMTDKGTVNAEHEHRSGGKGPQVAPFIAVTNDHPYGDSQPRLSQKAGPTSAGTQLSFVSVFSSILATLHTNLESKRARERSSSGEISESIGSKPVEILDSNFRALCYDALAGFVRGGLDFPFTKEVIPILQVQIGDVSPAEASARCQCAASVSESLVVSASIADKEVGDSYVNDAEALIRYILNFCTATEASNVVIGCQSLRALVSCIADSTSTFGPLVFDSLSDRLTVAVERLREVPGNLDDIATVESLLLILYDITCTSTAEQGGHFLTSEMLLRMLDVCSDISTCCTSEPTEVCRLLCVRFSAALLNKLSASVTESEAPSTELLSLLVALLRRDKEPLVRAFRDDGGVAIITDLVVQKLLGPQDPENAPNYLQLTYHDFMARETDNIIRFDAEETGMDGEAPLSAWLCGGNTLLTCRLGSKKSRYRGWLEVVVRSPTWRKRTLVRLPSTNSLDSPELPTSLWEDPSSRTDPVTSAAEAVVTDDMKSHFIEPSSEMKKAMSVLKRFDEMFDTKAGVPSVSSEEVGGEVVSSAYSEDAGSVEDWLQHVLKDPEAVQCVVNELLALGFSREVLSTTPTNDHKNLSNYFLPIERLSFTPKLQRAVSIIDRMPSFNTHKIALLRASDESPQHNITAKPSLEDMLLSSTSGSPKFLSFAEGLGKLVLTRHLKYYSGGLDTSGLDSDGKLSLIWLDGNDSFATSMCVFHVVPLMPEGPNNRKRHVGNDNVHIVYVEPGCALDQILRRGRGAKEKLGCSLVSGQFGFVIILVQTLVEKEGTVKVSIRLRDGLSDDIQSRLDHLVGEHLVSVSTAPELVRRLAIRADVSCRAIMVDHLGLPNWEERQSQIAAMQRHRIRKSS